MAGLFLDEVVNAMGPVQQMSPDFSHSITIVWSRIYFDRFNIVVLMADRIDELQAGSSRIVLANHIEPSSDLQKERQRATFSSTELSILINGGLETLQVSSASREIGTSLS